MDKYTIDDAVLNTVQVIKHMLKELEKSNKTQDIKKQYLYTKAIEERAKITRICLALEYKRQNGI